MEFISSSISTNPQISAKIPFLTWKCRRNPSSLIIPNSIKLPLYPLYLFRSVPSRKFEVSAHFGRSSNRQNYLRKKLTQEQLKQVSQDTVHEFDGVHISQSNFGSSGEKSENLEKSYSPYNESKFGNSSEDCEDLGRSSTDNNRWQAEDVTESERELGKKKIGESIMLNKLESWFEQYKKDSEFWGIGNGSIFTIFQDAEGKVERVVVNEDEIMRRSRVDPQLDNETENLSEVNFKISFARDLARDMENGSNVIPKNSSVAKFLLSGGKSHGEMESGSHVIPKNSLVDKFLVSGGKSQLMEVIRGVTLKPGSFSGMSRVGVLVLCGLSVIWAIRGLFTVGNNNKEYTRLEKEMLQRKIKARKEEEKMVKGSVEVMQDVVEPKSIPFKRPQLDKEELVNSIIKAKRSNSQMVVVEDSGFQNKEFKDKIEEIRAMARQALKTERGDSLPDTGDGEDCQGSEELSSHDESLENDCPIRKEVYNSDSDVITDPNDDIRQSTDEATDEKRETLFHGIPNGTGSLRSEVSDKKLVPESSDSNEANAQSGGPGWQSGQHENSPRKKLRIIKSAKEAREYLSRKQDVTEVNQKHDVANEHADIATPVPSSNIASGNTSQILDLTNQICDSPPLSGIDDFPRPSGNYGMGSETAEGNMDTPYDFKIPAESSGHEISISSKDVGVSVYKIPGKKETDIRTSQNCNSRNETSSVGGKLDSTSNEVNGGSFHTEGELTPLKDHKSEDNGKTKTLVGFREPETATANEVRERTAELALSVSNETWMEKNFHEFEPIVKKIGVGFRDSYLLAREKASQELGSETDLVQLKSDGAENDLEWMKDERLREIVFKVRDNEISGRDPFHLMDEEDKSTFFSGLEKKVERENEKLLKLHEYFHSNIENLDYGADGISLYDPPEKIIPRWKVPPAEKNPEFLNNFMEQRKEVVAESLKNSVLAKKTAKEAIHKPEKPSSHEKSTVADPRSELQKDNLASSKTVIEGSDGSIRVGKKSGREYWQHTKKWSEGFLESYNAETDPEVKGVMRDIGKDLDRWITEKEIKEAAELMDKVPEKGQKFIKQKLDKVKREMELFGPQAVVSKYREYAEEKEEDYLWWLDLPFVLCMELYTIENGEQRVGFYSLEMAADLELDPKQYHVIAFEYAGDCKNLCYIIQAQMEVLGNGNAFVVARPPKDAFREAKANGFSVTVIKKGQLQLNIDQTLEEVEESIMEIGSQIYHDKITKERSVDINALMKGVFGVSKPAKRKRSKRKLKRRIKPGNS